MDTKFIASMVAVFTVIMFILVNRETQPQYVPIEMPLTITPSPIPSDTPVPVIPVNDVLTTHPQMQSVNPQEAFVLQAKVCEDVELYLAPDGMPSGKYIPKGTIIVYGGR